MPSIVDFPNRAEEKTRDDRERSAVEKQRTHIQEFIDKNIGGGSKVHFFCIFEARFGI